MTGDEFSGLHVASSTLVFPSTLSPETSTTVGVENSSGVRVAFKVLTTSPERYSVVPCRGIMEARETLTMEIRLRRSHVARKRTRRCMDKFLIRSVEIGSFVHHLPEQIFEPSVEGNQVCEVKLEAWLEEQLTEETSPTEFGSPLSPRTALAAFDLLDPNHMETPGEVGWELCVGVMDGGLIGVDTPRMMQGKEFHSLAPSPRPSFDHNPSTSQQMQEMKQRLLSIEDRLMKVETLQSNANNRFPMNYKFKCILHT